MPLASGTRLGPYEILGPIGAGGMGEVYRARDTSLGREVAIKVLPAAFAQDPERVARFRREAQLLAAFNHPNIASIHGLEEQAGTLALALELVDGEDLHQRLRNGPIPLEEARAIGRQIAEGLEAAHEKGIVHRDLKPANVKVTPDGHVKVLDFGLAKAFDTSSEPSDVSTALANSPTMSWKATEAGIILGTAAYMSPEQARGRAVDKRSDIWAFGVVLFEMLSGRRLFTGETPSDTLAAVLRQEIDWSLLPKDLPPVERRLIERCLERDPKKRLRDIGEARIALDPASASTSMVSTAGLAAAPPTPPALSRRAWLVAAGSGASGLAMGLGLGFWRGRTTASIDGSAGALTITPITGSGNVIEAAISPDGRYVAYVESEQGLQSLWIKQLAGGQTLRLLPEAGVGFWGHTFTPDGNNIVYGQKTLSDPLGSLYSISTLGGTPRRLLTDMDSQVSFSPDGRKFAYARLRHPTVEETSLMVANADGSSPTVLASFKRPEAVAGIFFGAPAWSPDGKLIATSVLHRGGFQGAETRTRLVAVDATTGAVSTISDPGWVTAAQSLWRPDGRSLLVIARTNEQNNAQIWSVTYPGGQARQITSDLNDHRILSLTRDGRTLVSVSGDISSAIWTLPLNGSGKPKRVSRSRMDGLGGIAFTPEGGLVYTSYVAGVWSVWRSATDGSDRTPVFTLGVGDDIVSPTVAPDGTIYYAQRGRTGTNIRATSKDGGATRTVAGDVRPEALALSPDGQSVVFGATVGGIPRIFQAAVTGAERKQVTDLKAFTVTLDPTGTKVAFYFFDNADQSFRLGVAPMAGGPLIANLPAEPSTTNSRLVLRSEGLYLNTMPGDRANVWLIPLDGKPARRITGFEDQILFDFAISPDGKTLAVVRGPRVRDAQLITGF